MNLTDVVPTVLRHPMRAYYLPITAGMLLGASAFMPWIAVEGQQFGGIPDVAGFWVLAFGVLAVALASVSIVTRKNSRHPLLLVGLAAFAVLFLAEQLMERSVVQRSWATSQARAIVIGGLADPAVEPVMASGVYLGLAASMVLALFGFTVVVRRSPQIYAEAEDDDV